MGKVSSTRSEISRAAIVLQTSVMALKTHCVTLLSEHEKWELLQITSKSNELSQGERRLELRKHDFICPAGGGVCGVRRSHIQSSSQRWRSVFLPELLEQFLRGLKHLEQSQCSGRWDCWAVRVHYPTAWPSTKLYPLPRLRHSWVVITSIQLPCRTELQVFLQTGPSTAWAMEKLKANICREGRLKPLDSVFSVPEPVNSQEGVLHPCLLQPRRGWNHGRWEYSECSSSLCSLFGITQPKNWFDKQIHAELQQKPMMFKRRCDIKQMLCWSFSSEQDGQILTKLSKVNLFGLQLKVQSCRDFFCQNAEVEKGWLSW